ncbi:hypothetical protein HYN48_14055 [Flavobacterium magnum]|uniref:Uncharacterized protein n=1 Tax=Flavobacterium magnum TaxID=2162713 RepID=A0A2S0RH96_9FLAO|nr:hypothetical protein HYN48_14055 [Flavobacterium magnum]
MFAQKSKINFQKSSWFLKIDSYEILSNDTLRLIHFSKIESSNPKLNKEFAEICYSDKMDITKLHFSKRNVYISYPSFDFCGPLGNIEEWNFHYNQEHEEVSFEINHNRLYKFKVLDKKINFENWSCGFEENDSNFKAEVEIITLVKTQ